jgi:hypothetical protein
MSGFFIPLVRQLPDPYPLRKGELKRRLCRPPGEARTRLFRLDPSPAEGSQAREPSSILPMRAPDYPPQPHTCIVHAHLSPLQNERRAQKLLYFPSYVSTPSPALSKCTVGSKAASRVGSNNHPHVARGQQLPSPPFAL